MSEQLRTTQVSIGDVIVEQFDRSPAVVVETRDSLQASHIVVDEHGDWRLGLPGTFTMPIDKIASLSIEATAKGLSVTLGNLSSLFNYENTLKSLLEKSKDAPVEVTSSTQ